MTHRITGEIMGGAADGQTFILDMESDVSVEELFQHMHYLNIGVAQFKIVFKDVSKQSIKVEFT